MELFIIYGADCFMFATEKNWMLQIYGVNHQEFNCKCELFQQWVMCGEVYSNVFHEPAHRFEYPLRHSSGWIDPMNFLAFIQNHKSNGSFDDNINQIFACVQSLSCCETHLSVDRSLCPSLLNTTPSPENTSKYLCFRNRITWPSLLQCSWECSN